MEASQERLDRGEAALRRAEAREEREQRIVESEMAESEVLQDSKDPARWEVLENKVRGLQEGFVAAASKLRAAQRELTREYERLAAEQPDRAAEYEHRAEQARRAATGPDADGLAGGENSD
ncbi:hypothetical protein ACFYVL_07135 [Streptomyces sp. NPDC004111]|uniref:hypothetical protein n=1 Tax=Streptomyces sp. NPDC004111 TaxID=3364690 RepID=UPI00369CCD29